MVNAGDENPYQSPQSSLAAAPWSTWRIWWAGSLVLVTLALVTMFVSIYLGTVMVGSALAISLRSAIELQRKFQAGTTIYRKTQFDAIASSFILLIAASIAGFIAFFVSCFSMAEATNAPMGEVGIRWNTLHTASIMATSVAIGLGIFGLILRLPSQPLKLTPSARPAELEEATSTEEVGKADV